MPKYNKLLPTRFSITQILFVPLGFLLMGFEKHIYLDAFSQKLRLETCYYYSYYYYCYYYYYYYYFNWPYTIIRLLFRFYSDQCRMCTCLFYGIYPHYITNTHIVSSVLHVEAIYIWHMFKSH